MNVTLSEAFTYLLSVKQRNFYARIISALIRKEVPGLGTMAVGATSDGKLCFCYDPEFIAKIHMQELVLICEHEIYHLILDHIPRYLDLISALQTDEERRRFQAVMNLAADCAANEMMRSEKDFDKKYGKWFLPRNPTVHMDSDSDSDTYTPKGAIIPETLGLPRRQPYEVYQFRLLKELKKTSKKLNEQCKMSLYTLPLPPGEDQGGKGGGSGNQSVAILEAYFDAMTGNAHQLWNEAAESKNPEELQGLADRIRQDTKNTVREAVNEHIKSRGVIPAGMKELIDKLLAPPVVPWPKLLRDVCVRTQQTKIERGMARPSRRCYGVPGRLPFPGRARDNKFSIGFALDTSGSMNRDDLALGINELLNIVRTEPDSTLWVMYCDAAINEIYEVNEISDINFTVSGRGGTDFNPIFIKARELLKSTLPIDILCIFTDGYAPDPAVENRVPIPVVWLISPSGRVPSPNYGLHIPMNPF